MTRLIMAVVVILAVVGGVLAATGVLHFRNTKDEAGVTIDKKELKVKTQEAVEKTEKAGGKILDKTGETLHKAAERMRGSSGDRNTPTTAPAADNQSTQQPNGSKYRPDNKERDESAR